MRVGGPAHSAIFHIAHFPHFDNTLRHYHTSHYRTCTLAHLHTSILLQYHTSTLLHFHTSTLSHFYTFTLLHFHTSTLSHFYNITLLHFHTFTLSHLYTFTLPHLYASTPPHFHTSTPSLHLKWFEKSWPRFAQLDLDTTDTRQTNQQQAHGCPKQSSFEKIWLFDSR